MSSPSPPPSPNQSASPSTQYKVEEIVTTVRVPIVRPKPAFQRVLQLGGSTGETYTMSEIIDIVKTYIEERKLYDEQDPRIVYCQNDPLGEALNVTSFTISEALKLFWENCNLAPDSCLRIKRQVVATPLNPASATENATLTSTEPNGQSPRGAQEPTQEVGPPEKNYVSMTATQPSTSITSSDIEEYEQRRGKETDKSALQNAEDEPKPSTSVSVFCDETDGNQSPWSCQVMVERHDSSSQQRVRNHDSLVVECTSDTFSVEYEVVSSSDTELAQDVVDNDESEPSSSNRETTEVYVVCQESDIEYLADYSDTDSDSDAELSSEDKWQCQQCKFKNCALYRNCERCWSIRPDWLPTPSSSGIGKNFGEDDHGNKCVTNTNADNTAETKLDSSIQKVSSIPTAEEVMFNDPYNGATVYSKKQSLNQVQDLSQDSAIGSLISSQEPLEDTFRPRQEDNHKEAEPAPHKQKREDSSDWSDSNEATAAKRLKKDLGKDADLKSSDPCVICLTRSKTASIIHGKTGHQVCCYRCAKRLKQQRKSCPICRRPIQKVIRNFF